MNEVFLIGPALREKFYGLAIQFITFHFQRPWDTVITNVFYLIVIYGFFLLMICHFDSFLHAETTNMARRSFVDIQITDCQNADIQIIDRQIVNNQMTDHPNVDIQITNRRNVDIQITNCQNVDSQIVDTIMHALLNYYPILTLPSPYFMLAIT
jgi:hypothetical protein